MLRLEQLARDVVANWESGDLAEAVRKPGWPLETPPPVASQIPPWQDGGIVTLSRV